MFDHPGPGSLMNSGNNLHHHQQQLPGQAHMGFGPPGAPFNQPGQGPLGLFQREPPRPNLPPHQGHQGMANLNQQGGPPNQPRPFMSPRQPFGQQGNMFPPPPVQFGLQVQRRVSGRHFFILFMLSFCLKFLLSVLSSFYVHINLKLLSNSLT